MTVEVGLLAGSIATAIAGTTAAAVTDGPSAILAAASALIGGLGLATVGSGLILRDLAHITRPMSMLLIVMAILLNGSGGFLIAIRDQRTYRPPAPGGQADKYPASAQPTGKNTSLTSDAPPPVPDLKTFSAPRCGRQP